MQGSFDDALNDSLTALHILGIEVSKAPTKRELDIMFEEVKDEILAIGFDEILAIPRATDPRTDLAVAVLNDAGVSRPPLPRSSLMMDKEPTHTGGMGSPTSLDSRWVLMCCSEASC